MLAISLILIGILLRFVPHAANFTPVAAIALFGGAYLNKRSAFIVPLILMIASDAVIGMHNVVIFTWGAFAGITLLGLGLQKKSSPIKMISFSLVSSLLFFIVSNFGVWLMGWYPRTTAGLVQCYTMALPFLRDFTVSTLVYSAIFFGSYELIARSVRDKKLAAVLLKK
jgi:hypothetical protein